MALFIYLFLLISTQVHAREFRPLLLLPQNKGIELKNDGTLNIGDRIYIYDQKQLDGVLEVIKCNSITCLGIIRKIRKNVVASYTHQYKTIDPYQKKNEIGASLGGPFFLGYRLNYLREFEGKWHLGGSLGGVDRERSKAKLRGKSFSLMGDIPYYYNEDWQLNINPFLEIGMFSGEVDFSSKQGPKEEVTVPFFGLGLSIGREWNIIVTWLKAGIAHNLLPASYKHIDGNSYKTLNAGSQFSLELGFSYKF